MASLIGFPEVVNEKAARSVAAGVVVLTSVVLVAAAVGGSVWLWGSAVLAVGFALRVAAGPRIDPLGRFAAGVVAPRLGLPRFVAGAPKRFAQGIGLAVTTGATLAVALGAPVVAVGLLAVLVVFALLESALGFCAGCWMYGQLIRVGVLPDSACVDCADITTRRHEHAHA